MKRRIKHIVSVFCLIALITSCNKITPAGFWTDLHKDIMLTKKSDHGLWGGHTEIKWKSEVKNTFTNKELIEFASNNDWKLKDSISFWADTLTKKLFFETKK